MRCKISLLILILSMSTSLRAGVWATNEATIESLHYESNFMVIKLVNGEFSLSDGCEVQNQVVLADETMRGDRQLSLLLSAYMSGKSVAIYTSGCVTLWDKKYPKIWAVKVKN